MQQSVAPGMEGASLQAVDVGTLEFLANTGQHLASGIVGVSKRKNFVGASMALTNKVSDPLREDSRLPSPSAGNYQHRTCNVCDRLLLMLVRKDVGEDKTGVFKLEVTRSHYRIAGPRISERVVEDFGFSLRIAALHQRSASNARAQATIAAVSARRIVSPREAATHPDSRNQASSSVAHPPQGRQRARGCSKAFAERLATARFLQIQQEPCGSQSPQTKRRQYL